MDLRPLRRTGWKPWENPMESRRRREGPMQAARPSSLKQPSTVVLPGCGDCPGSGLFGRGCVCVCVCGSAPVSHPTWSARLLRAGRGIPGVPDPV